MLNCIACRSKEPQRTRIINCGKSRNGMLEYWNDGILGTDSTECSVLPAFHYCVIPSFQCSTNTGGSMSRSLIVMPDDSARPILEAIAAAKKSLRIKMFLFSDPALLAAVIAAQNRGVKVRVMLNPARRGGEPENEPTRKTLRNAGVEVIDSNPAFAVTHEKSMVVDDEMAFVKSLNWETKILTETRDYAVVTTDAGEVKEVIDCFEADWHRKK